MPKLSLMTCNWSVSMYSALHMRRPFGSASDDGAHALLERGAGVQAAQRVVAALDEAVRLARKDVAEARIARA